MSLAALIAAVAVITMASRVVAVAVLPPPPELLSATVSRLPAPLFAALAAHTMVDSAGGGLPDVAILVAVCCAAAASARWPSLLIALAAGLGGFVAVSFVGL